MSGVVELFRRQSGLASTSQLVALGMTRSELRARLQREWWVVLPHVVAGARTPLDDHQRMVAATLFAGRGAMIASHSAAAWHGVRAAAITRMVCVAIPASRCIRSQAFVTVRRTTRPDATAWNREPLLISSPARAVADAARDFSRERARAVVIEAVQRRLVTLAALRHELHAGPRLGSAALAGALREAERGAWSIPEADLAALVAQSSLLPPMWLNPLLRVGDLRLPTPDGWFDDVGLAVQVHSRRFHAGELDWEATVSADGVFAEYGIPVVGVTPRQIAVEGVDVVRRLERAHRAAMGRPRPDVLAVPVTVQS